MSVKQRDGEREMQRRQTHGGAGTQKLIQAEGEQQTMRDTERNAEKDTQVENTASWVTQLSCGP